MFSRFLRSRSNRAMYFGERSTNALLGVGSAGGEEEEEEMVVVVEAVVARGNVVAVEGVCWWLGWAVGWAMAVRCWC